MNSLLKSIRKPFLLIALLWVMTVPIVAQVSVTNDSSAPDPSAMLDVQSTEKGMLVPRMTTAQRELINSPATGLLVFDTDSGAFWFYTGSAWENLSSGAATDKITDADDDTKVQVEESADEDVIRFDVGGTEFGRMDGQTFHLGSSGFSLFVGEGAGANDDGTNNLNTYFGYHAGNAGSIGFRNTLVGYLAGEKNVSGGNNTFVGSTAGRMNTGGGNTFIGSSAGENNTSGSAGVFIGDGAGKGNTNGDWNIYIGISAGETNQSGSRNTIVGRWAGFSNQGSGNVFIGDRVAENEIGSDKLYIDNSNTSAPLIYGEFNNDLLRINGSLDLAGHALTNAGTITADTLIGDGSLLTNVPGDDLGNHSATADINLDDNYLSNGTPQTGLKIDDNGMATLRTNSGTSIGLQLQGGDTPALRFYQDGSQWPAYTWDVTGNESSFLVRDVSGGSKLPLKINAGSSNNRIVVDGDNVGIGADDPSASLDINGQIRMRPGAADGRIPVSDANGTMTWKDPVSAVPGDDLGNHEASQNINLNGNWVSGDGTNKGIYVTDAGYVGMGTSSPSTALHLKSGVVGDSTGLEISQAGYNSLFYHNSSGDLVMRKLNQTDQLVLGAGGSVGIGVSPTQKLDVDGKIRMRDGASAGYVPVSDANGVMTWTDPATIGDDLGNHSLTENMVTSNHWISRDGDDEGINIGSDGQVRIGPTAPPAPLLSVSRSADNPGGSPTYACYIEGLTNNYPVMIVSGTSGNHDVLTVTSEATDNILVAEAEGHVGIGTGSPGYPLHVVGNAAKTSGAFWTVVSDRRLKSDIRAYDEGLTELLNLNPVYFKYNNKSGFDPTEQHIGLIAQEVQAIVPHMVEEHSGEGEAYLDINPSAMLYMSINAFKELHERNNELQMQLDTQAAMIRTLQEQVTMLADKATDEAPVGESPDTDTASTN